MLVVVVVVVVVVEVKVVVVAVVSVVVEDNDVVVEVVVVVTPSVVEIVVVVVTPRVVDIIMLAGLFVWTMGLLCGISNVIFDLKSDSFFFDISISIFAPSDAKVELIPSNSVRSNSPDVVSAVVGIAFVGTLFPSSKPNELFNRILTVV